MPWVGALLCVFVLAARAQGLPALETAIWPGDREPPTPAELASRAADPGFVEQDAPARYLGPDRQRMQWWRVRIDRPWDNPSHPILALYAPYTNTVQVLMPPDYRLRRMSLRSSDFDRTHSRHALVLELPDAWEPSQPVYIGVEPGQRLPMRMELVTNGEFEAADIRHLQWVWSLFAGIAMVMVVVAVFGVVMRARELLYLAASIAAMLLFQGLVLGEFYSLPVGQWLATTDYRIIWFARSLQEAFLLLFAVEFLGTRRHLPNLGRALQVIAACFLVLAVLAWVPLSPFAGKALPAFGSVLLALGTLLLLVTLVLRVRQRNLEAWFFLVAWLPLLVLDGLRELELLRLTSLYPDNEYVPLYASAWASLMLAVGVAKRMHAVLDERDVAVVAAELDPLTGVFNHRAILERLQRAAAGAANGVSVLYLDLDHFKLVNDRFGHAVGDACLTVAVGVIRSELRAGDSLGRLGGEEFLAVLPGANQEQALRIGERIRAEVERVGETVADHDIRLTISIGLASAESAAACGDLVDRADQAMYQAKGEGRNRVRVATAGT
ncbi:diguanylate cyclase [Luteimonas vadosa]